MNQIVVRRRGEASAFIRQGLDRGLTPRQIHQAGLAAGCRFSVSLTYLVRKRGIQSAVAKRQKRQKRMPRYTPREQAWLAAACYEFGLARSRAMLEDFTRQIQMALADPR